MEEWKIVEPISRQKIPKVHEVVPLSCPFMISKNCSRQELPRITCTYVYVRIPRIRP